MVATYNPVSYFIEAYRSLIVTGWDFEALALGFGLAITIGGVALVLASNALRQRLAR
jgi:ABC-2 type transport system permease protein